MNSYRTIEEAKIRDSGDQPDAPKQSNKIIQHQLRAMPLVNFNTSAKNNIKLQKKHSGLQKRSTNNS